MLVLRKTICATAAGCCQVGTDLAETFYGDLVSELPKFEVFMSAEKKPPILCIDDYENALLGQRMLLEREGATTS